MLFSNNR